MQTFNKKSTSRNTWHGQCLHLQPVLTGKALNQC